MVINWPHIVPFLTSLAPIDNLESYLSIGGKLVKNEAMQDRFMGKFFFFDPSI